jgi:coatomer protein complex subunit alpha (xenin)
MGVFWPFHACGDAANAELLFSVVCLQEAKRGLGASAVFIARNRFAVLDKASSTIQVRLMQRSRSAWLAV